MTHTLHLTLPYLASPQPVFSHLQLAVVLNNLASTMEKLGSPREAQALYRQAIAICNASLPRGHPRLKHIQAKLAELELQLFSFPGMEPPPPMPPRVVALPLGATPASVGAGEALQR